MEKILFLDFDGVIITPRATLLARRGVVIDARSSVKLDPIAVEVIQRCCEAGARIVVSSSWRTLEENCRAILARCELVPYLHVDWRTRDDDYKTADSRGHQIEAWLAAHPLVRSYRIVDDDCAVRPSQKPYFVQCNAYDGLSFAGIKNLFDWIGIDLRRGA